MAVEPGYGYPDRSGYYAQLAANARSRVRYCRCTPEDWPCHHCAALGCGDEDGDFDPCRAEEGLRAAERSYERWLDEIGGSR